jgi:PEGA domain
MKLIRASPTLFLVLWSVLGASQPDSFIALWPDTTKPSLKMTFSKFQKKGLINGQGIYYADVVVQNLSEVGIPRSVFTVYVADKDNVRVGQALLRLNEIGPYRSQNTQIQFSVSGVPASVSLLAGKTISLQVISIPPGANFKVDGEDSGLTPKLVDFTIGTHNLQFSKEGYAIGSTTIEVSADELPGGSVSFELGGFSQDTVELRDGSVLLCDVLAMSITTVTVSVDGKVQEMERNRIKKIMLVQREAPLKSPSLNASPGPKH